MQEKFNLYDFLGYIVPGLFISIFLVISFVETTEIKKFLNSIESYKYVISIGGILVSYALGHIVSLLGSLIFERFLIKSWIGNPSEIFFGVRKEISKFYDYAEVYPKDFIKSFEKKYEDQFKIKFSPGEGFINCFHFVKEKSSQTLTRLNTFLSIYGFARNMAAAFLLFGIGCLGKFFIDYDLQLIIYGFIGLFGAFLFFLRYLKFFSQYGDEVIRTFFVLNK
jgi:hypothetical protein